jgi:hypothetical protein
VAPLVALQVDTVVPILQIVSEQHMVECTITACCSCWDAFATMQVIGEDKLPIAVMFMAMPGDSPWGFEVACMDV